MSEETERPEKSITEILRDWSDGKSDGASEKLLQVVYDELHRQAHRYLQKERAGHTLQTTALVNEAYLRLIKQKNVNWKSRSHFFGIAATLMRRILIDYAKAKHRVRRGGAAKDLPLERAVNVSAGSPDFDLLALDEALARLNAKDRQLARIVELRFFCGLDIVQTADALGVSESTVKREWAMAKAWLFREMTK